jgi:hypothetical protein
MKTFFTVVIVCLLDSLLSRKNNENDNIISNFKLVEPIVLQNTNFFSINNISFHDFVKSIKGNFDYIYQSNKPIFPYYDFYIKEKSRNFQSSLDNFLEKKNITVREF